MDHVNRTVLIQHEHDLEQSAPEPATPDKPLVILVSVKWIRGSRIPYDDLGLVRPDSMRINVLSIPPVPSKLHSFII